MNISNNYVCVERIEEPPKEGFQTVEVQDNFLYRAKVHILPEIPVFMGNRRLGVGEVVLFAKYSPDTHEIEHEGKKLKFVSIRDILAVE